jgi:hypothetical protein
MTFTTLDCNPYMTFTTLDCSPYMTFTTLDCSPYNSSPWLSYSFRDQFCSLKYESMSKVPKTSSSESHTSSTKDCNFIHVPLRPAPTEIKTIMYSQHKESRKENNLPKPESVVQRKVYFDCFDMVYVYRVTSDRNLSVSSSRSVEETYECWRYRN